MKQLRFGARLRACLLACLLARCLEQELEEQVSSIAKGVPSMADHLEEAREALDPENEIDEEYYPTKQVVSRHPLK